jgi:quercetin dioxygenase-like cupin family protein
MTPFPDRIERLPRLAGDLHARGLPCPGCEVLFVTYPAAETVAAHAHASETVGLVTAGEMRLTVGGVERCYRAAQWYHIPAEAPHAARFTAATAVIEFRFAGSTP